MHFKNKKEAISASSGCTFRNTALTARLRIEGLFIIICIHALILMLLQEMSTGQHFQGLSNYALSQLFRSGTFWPVKKVNCTNTLFYFPLQTIYIHVNARVSDKENPYPEKAEKWFDKIFWGLNHDYGDGAVWQRRSGYFLKFGENFPLWE